VECHALMEQLELETQFSKTTGWITSEKRTQQ